MKMEKATKTTFWLIGLTIVSILMHNYLAMSLEIEEVVFFGLAFVFMLAALVALIYCTISFIMKGHPKDLWKLGFLGLLGLIGLHPDFSDGFYGLFGFYGYFGATKRKK